MNMKEDFVVCAYASRRHLQRDRAVYFRTSHDSN
jgi:hypothetical protein